MDADDLPDSLKSGKLLWRVAHHRYKDGSRWLISLRLSIFWNALHWWVNDLNYDFKPSLFVAMDRCRINYDSIQIIKLSAAHSSLREICVHMLRGLRKGADPTDLLSLSVTLRPSLLLWVLQIGGCRSFLLHRLWRGDLVLWALRSSPLLLFHFRGI